MKIYCILQAGDFHSFLKNPHFCQDHCIKKSLRFPIASSHIRQHDSDLGAPSPSTYLSMAIEIVLIKPSLSTHFNSIISPFQDVLKGLIAIVGLKLHEKGRTEGIGVSNEAEHSHRHLS